jgi:2-polyprenyl-6-methoxyphenol hydroxylase-like FAD-dependent oxidoreductase
MRILVVGAGPAGLSLGRALRQLSSSCEVTICERRERGDSIGWGITLHPATMPSFGEAASRSYVDISPFEVRCDGALVRTRPFLNHGVARYDFRNMLLALAVEAGARVEFGVDGHDAAEWDDYDLVVGCDGASSTVRGALSDEFGTKIDHGSNYFVWLGTPVAPPGLRSSFRHLDDHVVSLTTYPYAASWSTAIVECGENAWRALGYDSMPVGDAARSLSELFCEELGGHELCADSGGRWQRFGHVTNERWHVGRVTLLGDALHTTHYSMGVGTRLALGDARALCNSIRQSQGDLREALPLFERRRRPAVEQAQSIANKGMRWAERLHAPANAGILRDLLDKSGPRDDEPETDPRDGSG